MWIRTYIFPIYSANSVHEFSDVVSVNASIYLLRRRKLSPITRLFESNGNEVILVKLLGSSPLVLTQSVKK